MNPFRTMMTWIGVPLGLVVLRLFGRTGVVEGFHGFAKWFGVCYYCGIVTILLVVGILLIVWSLA